MSYLMAFNIISIYKKGTNNKLTDMLYGPLVKNLLASIRIQPLVLEESYKSNSDFKNGFE